MRTILVISIVVLLLVFSAIAQSQPNNSCEAHSNDALPKYRIAQRHDLKEGLEIVVSLGPENVSQDHLVAIGCKLGRKFRAQPF